MERVHFPSRGVGLFLRENGPTTTLLFGLKFLERRIIRPRSQCPRTIIIPRSLARVGQWCFDFYSGDDLVGWWLSFVDWFVNYQIDRLIEWLIDTSFIHLLFLCLLRFCRYVLSFLSTEIFFLFSVNLNDHLFIYSMRRLSLSLSSVMFQIRIAVFIDQVAVACMFTYTEKMGLFF